MTRSPRAFTMTWAIKCGECGASSSGGAVTPGEAFGAMTRFYTRTCESFHFDEVDPTEAPVHTPEDKQPFIPGTINRH